ncbi:hypothetical protein A9Z42_0063910 [Trichoderma parareesei]|uniref:PARP-type domain-containing protein n=1 Tax=Trichoderma parareesei TaxID=858221 RepID=A0A2H2ZDP4_TRIPA|nr:hypothetical protein A9Z42_0063910 [Trichoderma parareesei]
MGEYRIEVSPNKRAGCTDTVCKQGEVKIQKGELRFGSWTVIKEHGSWRWKHWGCVSGSQLVNLQEACGGDHDNLDFDAIDGFDELQDEELKEKVKRCVRQGHIDPEDFNGVGLLLPLQLDPEKNRPGEKGIHLTAKQKEAKEKAAALEAGESQSAASQKNTKRGRKKAADDVADEPEPKKARKSKDIDADEEQPKTKAKARVKGEDNVKRPASLKRGRPRRSSVQQDEEVESEEAEKPAPARKVAKRGLKAKATKAEPEEEMVKEEEVDEVEDVVKEEEEEEEEEKVIPVRASSGRKQSSSRAKAAATTDEDESGAKYTPVSASRGRKRAAVGPQAEEQDEETLKAVAKRGRKAASAKKANPDGVEGAEEEAPKPRGRGRPRKSV